MTEPKFTKEQIVRNIKQHAKAAGKTIEGIYYKCKNEDSYWYTTGMYNVVMMMNSCRGLNNDRKFIDLCYFKCTKSGRIEEHEMFL